MWIGSGIWWTMRQEVHNSQTWCRQSQHHCYQLLNVEIQTRPAITVLQWNCNMILSGSCGIVWLCLYTLYILNYRISVLWQYHSRNSTKIFSQDLKLINKFKEIRVNYFWLPVQWIQLKVILITSINKHNSNNFMSPGN